MKLSEVPFSKLRVGDKVMRLQQMKLTTDAYEFTIGEDLTPGARPRFTIALLEIATGKVKEFTSMHGSIEGHGAHMSSLTDDLCSSWFREKPEKKPKIKKPSVQTN